MPLVLTRKQGETVIIFKDGGRAEDAIAVTVIETGRTVKLMFEAEKHMKILRKELLVREERPC